MKIFQVDSFTGVPFGGNPAGVCILEKEIEERQYLNIAAEMNLSETAFVNPLTKSNTFGLRWFTPKTEVKMCGHATLATAWVQFTELGIEGEIFYETLSGRLKVRYVDGKIEMDFPSDDPVRVPIDDALESIIGVKGKATIHPQRKNFSTSYHQSLSSKRFCRTSIFLRRWTLVLKSRV